MGADDPRITDSLDILAAILRQTGKLTEAEELLQRTLRIKETAFGSEDARVAQALNSLGDFYRVQSNFPAAEPILTRALSILDAAPNASPDDWLHTMLQLANLYAALERYAEMDELYQRILPLLEEHGDKARLQYAVAIAGLAWTQAIRAKYAEAEAGLQLAQKMLEKSQGIGQFEFAKVLYHLGMVYELQGQGSQAETSYRQAIAAAKPLGAPGAKLIEQILPKLSDIYAGTGDDASTAQARQREIEALDPQYAAARREPRTPPSNARRVMLRGSVQVDELDFGGCPAVLVATIQNQNGADSYRSTVFNVQQQAFAMIFGISASLTPDTQVDGFQVIPDADGFYAVCDAVDPTTTQLTYRLSGFYFASGCAEGKPVIKLIPVNMAVQSNRPAEQLKKRKPDEVEKMNFYPYRITTVPDTHNVQIKPTEYNVIKNALEYDRHFAGQTCE